MNVKKAYTELHKQLTALAKAGKPFTEATLETLMPLMVAKTGGGTAKSSAIFDKTGKPVAIKDYYFKRWMPLVGDKAVPFGSKASSATKLNTMCKEGVKHWTKQNNTFNKAKAEIMEQVLEGTLKGPDAKAKIATLEKERAKIAQTDLGFASRKEVESYLRANKVVLLQGDETK